MDASGVVPPPARVGRSDVAALAIASCDMSILPLDTSSTLAVRWVGEVAPKAQAKKEDGFDSAEACLESVAANGIAEYQEPSGIKPYGVAVGLFFYSFAAVSIKIGSVLLRAAMKVFRRA